MYSLWYAYFIYKNSNVKFGDIPFLRKPPPEKISGSGSTPTPPKAAQPPPSAPVRNPSTPKDIPGRSPPVQAPVPPPVAVKKAPPPVQPTNRFLPGYSESISDHLNACISAVVRRNAVEQQAAIEAFVRTAGYLESEEEKQALEERVRADIANKDRELAAALDQCLKEAGKEAEDLAVKHAREAFEKLTKKFNDEMAAASAKVAADRAAAKEASTLGSRIREVAERTALDEFSALEECVKSADALLSSKNQAATLEKCLQSAAARKAAADSSAMATILEDARKKIASEEEKARQALLQELLEREKAEAAEVEQCVKEATAKKVAEETTKVEKLFKKKAQETLALADTEVDLCIKNVANVSSAEVRDNLESCIKRAAKKKADTDAAAIEAFIADAAKKIQDEELAMIQICTQKAMKNLKGGDGAGPSEKGKSALARETDKDKAGASAEDDLLSKSRFAPEEDENRIKKGRPSGKDDGKIKEDLPFGKDQDTSKSKAVFGVDDSEKGSRAEKDNAVSKAMFVPGENSESKTGLTSKDRNKARLFSKKDDAKSLSTPGKDDARSRTGEDDARSKSGLTPGRDDARSRTGEDDAWSKSSLTPGRDDISKAELIQDDDKTERTSGLTIGEDNDKAKIGFDESVPRKQFVDQTIGQNVECRKALRTQDATKRVEPKGARESNESLSTGHWVDKGCVCYPQPQTPTRRNDESETTSRGQGATKGDNRSGTSAKTKQGSNKKKTSRTPVMVPEDCESPRRTPSVATGIEDQSDKSGMKNECINDPKKEVSAQKKTSRAPGVALKDSDSASETPSMVAGEVYVKYLTLPVPPGDIPSASTLESSNPPAGRNVISPVFSTKEQRCEDNSADEKSKGSFSLEAKLVSTASYGVQVTGNMCSEEVQTMEKTSEVTTGGVQTEDDTRSTEVQTTDDDRSPQVTQLLEWCIPKDKSPQETSALIDSDQEADSPKRENLSAMESFRQTVTGKDSEYPSRVFSQFPQHITEECENKGLPPEKNAMCEAMARAAKLRERMKNCRLPSEKERLERRANELETIVAEMAASQESKRNSDLGIIKRKGKAGDLRVPSKAASPQNEKSRLPKEAANIEHIVGVCVETKTRFSSGNSNKKKDTGHTLVTKTTSDAGFVEGLLFTQERRSMKSEGFPKLEELTSDGKALSPLGPEDEETCGPIPESSHERCSPSVSKDDRNEKQAGLSTIGVIAPASTLTVSLTSHKKHPGEVSSVETFLLATPGLSTQGEERKAPENGDPKFLQVKIGSNPRRSTSIISRSEDNLLHETADITSACSVGYSKLSCQGLLDTVEESRLPKNDDDSFDGGKIGERKNSVERQCSESIENKAEKRDSPSNDVPSRYVLVRASGIARTSKLLEPDTSEQNELPKMRERTARESKPFRTGEGAVDGMSVTASLSRLTVSERVPLEFSTVGNIQTDSASLSETFAQKDEELEKEKTRFASSSSNTSRSTAFSTGKKEVPSRGKGKHNKAVAVRRSTSATSFPTEEYPVKMDQSSKSEHDFTVEDVILAVEATAHHAARAAEARDRAFEAAGVAVRAVALEDVSAARRAVQMSRAAVEAAVEQAACAARESIKAVSLATNSKSSRRASALATASAVAARQDSVAAERFFSHAADALRCLEVTEASSSDDRLAAVTFKKVITSSIHTNDAAAKAKIHLAEAAIAAESIECVVADPSQTDVDIVQLEQAAAAAASNATNAAAQAHEEAEAVARASIQVRSIASASCKSEFAASAAHHSSTSADSAMKKASAASEAASAARIYAQQARDAAAVIACSTVSETTKMAASSAALVAAAKTAAARSASECLRAKAAASEVAAQISAYIPADCLCISLIESTKLEAFALTKIAEAEAAATQASEKAGDAASHAATAKAISLSVQELVAQDEAAAVASRYATVAAEEATRLAVAAAEDAETANNEASVCRNVAASVCFSQPPKLRTESVVLIKSASQCSFETARQSITSQTCRERFVPRPEKPGP